MVRVPPDGATRFEDKRHAGRGCSPEPNRIVPAACVTLLLALILCAPILAATPPSPQIVFVPSPQAYALAKHPTLPVLYVGCSVAPESKNLITYRIDAEGKLIADSRRDWPDWFTTDGKNRDFMYQLWRPAVWAEKKVLYLTAAPSYADRFYGVTNHPEFVAVSLDAEGQPAKRVAAWRSGEPRGTPMGIRCDPATRRLYVNYYFVFGWCALDEKGLPTPNRFQQIPFIGNFWDWTLASEWHRCFGMPGGMNVSMYQLATDGGTALTCQNIAAENQGYIAGHVPRDNIEVSTRFQKLYMLRYYPKRQLMVCSLTRDGRLTGLPKYFEVGPARAIRFNFKAGLLHAFAHEWMKTFALDADGYPTGTPSEQSLSCGKIADILVDKTSGTVYVACSQPPTEK